MKIDRLIGILSILLQQDMITAPELAERFEVSRRTINRDIEALCKAGIPITTTQGVGGGISVMDGYSPSKMLFTSKDMQGILAGLRSLDSVSGTKYYSHLMEKLSLGSSQFVSGKDTMLIDLSSWSKEALTPKLELIGSAIENKREIVFRYFSPKEESMRRIEPYYLVFKWSSWYVYGYCLERNDFRMFKLNRMDGLTCTGIRFESREIPVPDFSNETVFQSSIAVRAIFQPDVKWRLIEEYGLHSIQEQEDGTLLFEGQYSGMQELIGWMLSFGDRVELLEPISVRQELLKIANNLTKIYGGNGYEKMV